jgi:hypothetical protein
MCEPHYNATGVSVEKVPSLEGQQPPYAMTMSVRCREGKVDVLSQLMGRF